MPFGEWGGPECSPFTRLLAAQRLFRMPRGWRVRAQCDCADCAKMTPRGRLPASGSMGPIRMDLRKQVGCGVKVLQTAQLWARWTRGGGTPLSCDACESRGDIGRPRVPPGGAKPQTRLRVQHSPCAAHGVNPVAMLLMGPPDENADA